MSKLYESIPQEMKNLPQWVVWGVDKTRPKMPFNPANMQPAKAGDFTTWADYVAAENRVKAGQALGVGFEFSDNGIVGIDLDKVIEGGKLLPDAEEIYNLLDSYTEVSPSGTGLHIFVKADIGLEYNRKGSVEIYKDKRYFTVTGNVYKDLKPLQNRSEELKQVYQKYVAPKQQTYKAPSPRIDPDQRNIDYFTIGMEKDAELIDLFNGNRRSGDESGDDQSLMNKLAFWCNCDEHLMKQVFFESPHYQQKDQKHKKKCDRNDYIDRTIHVAIRDCQSTAREKNSQYQQERADQAARQSVTNKTPPASKESKAAQKPLKTYTAQELASMDLKPPEFIVEGLLPKGVTILAAPSKIGKSWLALDLALSVTRGATFMGYQSNKCHVLYLALEDGLFRLNSRIDKLLCGTPRPEGFMASIESENMSNGFMEQINALMKEHPEVKLIIIDTLQKVKPPSEKGMTAYEQDYTQLGRLAKFAKHHNIAILLIHHVRKSNGVDGDPFENILGSTALQGATDAMMVIKKRKRTDEVAVFSFTGRDVFQQELYIYFDSAQCRWVKQGTVDEIEEQKTTLYYDSDTLVFCIKKMVEESGMWEGTLKELQDEVIRLTGSILPEQGNALTTRIKRLAPMLEFRDSITYRHSKTPIKRNGQSVRLHSFQKTS